jgi:hypothetical protein
VRKERAFMSFLSDPHTRFTVMSTLGEGTQIRIIESLIISKIKAGLKSAMVYPKEKTGKLPCKAASACSTPIEAEGRVKSRTEALCSIHQGRATGGRKPRRRRSCGGRGFYPRTRAPIQRHHSCLERVLPRLVKSQYRHPYGDGWGHIEYLGCSRGLKVRSRWTLGYEPQGF